MEGWLCKIEISLIFYIEISPSINIKGELQLIIVEIEAKLDKRNLIKSET